MSNESKTLISNELLSDTSTQEYKVDHSNMLETIVDLSIPLNTRIKALDMYFEKKGRDNTIEMVNKLSMMYQFTGTRSIKNYLIAICNKSAIEPFLKSIAAMGLCMFGNDDLAGYEAIISVFPQLGSDVSTPYRIEMLTFLMKSVIHKQIARDFFCSIINDMEIECDYRYKAILALEIHEIQGEELAGVERKTHELERDRMQFFVDEACLEFLKNDKNMTMYRILSAQYILLRGDKDNVVQEILLEFAGDNDLDYDLRADATDVLLKYGNEKTKAIAKDIIMMLGRNGRIVRTLFDNAQNVHTDSIEKSVENAIEFLASFEILKINEKPIEFDYVEGKLLEMVDNERKELGLCKDDEFERGDAIKVALNRIYMDRSLYSKFTCSLNKILIRVWTYIAQHEHKDEMTKRLLEELCEMAGTCSSGFASRLVNTISSFGDFNMTITWREQIIGNLAGRLNARARNIDNLRFQEKVINEMMIETDNYEERKNFLRFFRCNILSIREELASEFREHISDNDFDLYFRAAISQYETGSHT